MDSTNTTAGNQPPWRGNQSPCVYCGQMIDRAADRCPHCRTSFSLAVRKASREVIGPWYYLDQRNPSGRGVTFETLIKMIEKGRIRADAVVRGPTTHQDWMYAAETPRLAKYLGMCPHCFAEAKPEDTYCTSCQLNMNRRPGEPRPGIPLDLAREPLHKLAHEMEKELAASVEPSAESVSGEPLDIPAPRPSAGGAEGAAAEAKASGAPGRRPSDAMAAPVPAAEPVSSRGESALAAKTPPPRPSFGKGASVQAVAAAALAESGATAGDRPSRVAAAQRQRRPRLWVLLALTWGTLLPLILVALWTDALLWVTPQTWHPAVRNLLHRPPVADGATAAGGATTTPSTPATPDAAKAWLNEKLAAVDKAEAEHDYERAIRILNDIKNTTGDKSVEPRIAALREKQSNEVKLRLVRMKDRLDLAEKLRQQGQFEDALKVLEALTPDDRKFLADPKTFGAKKGIDVTRMEDAIRKEQTRVAARKQQEEQLKADLTKIEAMKAAKQLVEAMAGYQEILSKYPADLISQQLDLRVAMSDLQKLLPAAPATPLPPAPPVEPPPTPPTTPTDTPPAPPAPPVAPGDADAAIKDLLTQAAAAEKAENFEAVAAKLEEIKTRFDRKFWPEGLDKRIQAAKAKAEALKFFGMEGSPPPKKAPAKKGP